MVAIWWVDIRAYADNILCEPTPMYTEGKLARETVRHFVLAKPETLCLKPLENHPRKRPRFYCIPKMLISSIESIGPRDRREI